MTKNLTEIYRESKASNYSVINNQFLKRNDLSWKAKGIMAYILSLPDDWKIYLEELEKHATDGRDSFRSGWNELKKAGYIERNPIREKGVIVAWKTVIKENVDMSAFSPLTDFPQVVNPQVVNPKLLSTNNTNYLNKEVVVADKPEQKRYFQTVWQESGMGMINGLLQQKLQCWVDDFNGEEEIINYAIELTAEQGGNSYKYVEAILKNWIGKCKTVEDAKALTLEFEKNKASRGGGYGKSNKPTAKPILKPEEMKQDERYARYLAANGLGANDSQQPIA